MSAQLRRYPPPRPHLREVQVGDGEEGDRDRKRQLLRAPRREAKHWGKVGPHPAAFKRSRAARRPMRKARVASCELSSCGGAFRTCTRTFGDPEPSMPPRTPGALKARAAWRRRHHRNRQPTDARLQMARHLPGAIPRQALTNARPKLGTPGSVLATTPQPPAGTSLTRGPGWGRRGRGL